MVIYIPLSKQGKYKGIYETLISDEDYSLAELRWNVAISRDNNVYAYGGFRENGKKTTVRLHRIILERMLHRPLEKHEQVDHIDGNGLNNQRSNLRLATHAQNQANIPAQRNNTSGFKGVYKQHKNSKRWGAVIRSNGVSYQLGWFNTPEEAYEAYCKKAKELNGEFTNVETRQGKRNGTRK